jgi:two-component system sensor kinase FixL
MANPGNEAQISAFARIEKFHKALGPFVVAAETTRMPMIFTDGQESDNPIVFANDAFLALTGFISEEILGKPLKFLLGDVTDSGTVSSIRSAIALGESGTWEMQCRRSDKSEFLASVFLCPVRDKNEIVQQNFLCLVELGGHIERLLNQRNEFHALYEQAPGFIATVEGPDHRFTFANASYKRFVGREHLQGKTVAEAIPEIVDQGFVTLLDQVYCTKEAFVGENMPIYFLNQSTRLMETRYANFVYQAISDANGLVTGLFCEGYDVTAQRVAAAAVLELQSELIHLSRVNAMGTMATTLAHELNQPLSAIANYTAGMRQLVGSTAPDDGQLMEALQGIDEASQRAGGIIRNLRELTRRREPTRLAFDLRSAVEECVRLVRATAAPEVQFAIDIPDGLTMLADRIQIQQVLINLLRNASEAAIMSDRSCVSVETKRVDDTMVVSVLDTGSGVPAKLAESIFSWSDSAKDGGMGLGLSICRTILEAHLGQIWLEKSGPEGSEFCFCVPIE